MKTLERATSPSYNPTSDQMLDPRYWRKRLTLLVGIASLLSGTMGALGARIVWPWDKVNPLAATVAIQDTAIVRVRTRVDSLERDRRADRYLLCEVLKRVSPKGAVIPETCTTP